VIFGVVLVLLTMRGLDPANSLTVSLFMPLTLLYGALMDYAYRRRFRAARETGIQNGGFDTDDTD
jgi:hypothetical protein